MTRQAWVVVVAAIAGLGMAVALALLTSHLTTQHVGLAGEPSRPATGLIAPAARSRPHARHKPHRTTTTQVTTTPVAPVATAPVAPVATTPVATTPARATPTASGERQRANEHERGDD
jgi:hypothetical protein